LTGITHINVLANAHEVSLYAPRKESSSLATIRLSLPFAEQLARMLTLLTDAASRGQLGNTTSLEANIVPHPGEGDEPDRPEEEIEEVLF
jgi:hypothetical protein